MRAVVLHGSPRRDGSSDTLAQRFLDGLGTSGPHLVQHFYSNDLSIRPCQGCEACNLLPDARCAMHDDMDAVYEALEASELVVWATPMYWGYMTAQMKTMLDRMEAIASRRILKGKVFVVILAFRHHYESTLAFFQRVFLDYFGVELHTVLFRSVDQSTGEDIHVNARPEMLDSAYRLGVDLSSHPAKNHTTSLS